MTDDTTKPKIIRRVSVEAARERAMAVWRGLAEKGGWRGLTIVALRERLPEDLRGQLKHDLGVLRMQGFAIFDGSMGSKTGRWKVSRTNLPKGQPRPAWMDDVLDAEDIAPLTPAVFKPAATTPNSAFDMGRAMGLADDTTAMQTFLASTGPKVAAPSTVVRLPVIERAAPGFSPDAPLYALLSDKTFYMHLPGREPLVLDQGQTRALFAYLDTIQGAAHASEAAA